MTDNRDRVAVVLMAYGTPRTPAEIEPYYTDIRRGRPPTPEALAELTARYAAIGGVSPLAELTEAQRDALQAALDAAAPGRYHVAIGLKHAAPKVEQTAAELAEAGFGTIVGLVLAPHYSAFSVGQYLDRLRDGVASAGSSSTVVGIESWATEPAFVDFVAADLRARVAAMRADGAGAVRVLFTAHSLPQRIIAAGDPYPAELRSTAEAVAATVGLTEAAGPGEVGHVGGSERDVASGRGRTGDDRKAEWAIAWQSAGRTPEPWIGPDILDVIDALGADERIGGVIVSAVGFVADHLEVLYDLDIEAAARARDVGLGFDRTACVNADPAVIGALARRIRAVA